MDTQLPKSMKVYDVDQFHQYLQKGTNHDMLIAEREYCNPHQPPEYIVFHQMGEFTVLERVPYSASYCIPNALHAEFTLELTPRYTTRNTAIEVYNRDEMERLVWVRTSGRIDTLARRWRGEDWDYVSDDISPEYANALFLHHSVGLPHVEFAYLKQNRKLFPGDQELLQQGE